LKQNLSEENLMAVQYNRLFKGSSSNNQISELDQSSKNT
jgi:hypothetical protein